VLAEQVEHGRLDRGDDVNGGAKVEGLLAAATGVAVGEPGAHLRQDVLVGGHAGAGDDRLAVPERLGDLFPARYLADADMAGGVLQHQDVAGEERGMGAGQVQLHAVVAGHRVDVELHDPGRAHDGMSPIRVVARVS
jgi:hypothetical protein